MINPYTFIIVIIILYNLFNSRNLKEFYIKLLMITLINECFIQIGYFVKIGNSEVSYRTICELLLFLTSILMLFKVKIQRSNFNNNFIFIIICILGILRIIIQPSKILASNINVSWDDFLSSGMVFENIHFVPFILSEFCTMFMLIISIMITYSIYTYKELSEFVIRFCKWSKLMLVIGCVEAVVKYVFKSNLYNLLCNFIFGVSSSTYNTIVSRGSGIVLQGLTKESSHYMYVLFIIIAAIFFEYKSRGKHNDKLWIIIAFVLEVMAMSFSAILFGMGILIICYFYWIRSSNTNQYKILKQILLFVLTLIVICIIISASTTLVNNLSINSENFWSRRIVSFFEEIKLILSGDWKTATTSLEWSNRSRLLSVFETLKLIIYRPLFGFGIGAVTSHGSSSMMLSGAGILGTLYWIKSVFYAKIQGFNDKCILNSEYLAVVLVWFMINMLNSMGLRPFYEISTLVLVLVFRNLFGEKFNEKYKI